eukprot:TRINITY_DN3806_c0_g1_i1.p1 TRINITY_DN3806_c0_g1~~TRINITY_DN3806_c0_g1_i1.p1  ORF type:complete len:113 (-),score=17.93 TRINITY_DN3806_c0_g1_i1:166-504(-)
MNDGKRTLLVASGGSNDVAFLEALNRASASTNVHVVSIDRDSTAEFDRLAQLCRERGRNCQFTQLQTIGSGTVEGGAERGLSRRAHVGESLCVAAQAVGAAELILGLRVSVQ